MEEVAIFGVYMRGNVDIDFTSHLSFEDELLLLSFLQRWKLVVNILHILVLYYVELH